MGSAHDESAGRSPASRRPSSSAPSTSASSATTVGAGSTSTTACRTCEARSEHSVIEIKPAGDPAHSWADGGTYLTFIRTEVDLATWRSIPRTAQERLVGRDKLTGAALDRVAGRNNVAVAGCPVAGTTEVIDHGNEAFRDAAHGHQPHDPGEPRPAGQPSCAQPGRRELVARVPTGLRVPRGLAERAGFRAGLNFVAFTDTPQRLARMLTTAGWLGETNFGGRVGTGRGPVLSAAPDGPGGGGLPRSSGDGR